VVPIRAVASAPITTPQQGAVLPKNRLFGLALAAATVLSVASVAPAQAAPAYGCDYDNTIVVYLDPNFGGECRAMSNAQRGDLRLIGINDQISSLRNRTPNTLCFYSNDLNGGAVFQIHGWEWWATIPSWIDNQISSMDYC
jgi:hypothetical protein